MCFVAQSNLINWTVYFTALSYTIYKIYMQQYLLSIVKFKKTRPITIKLVLLSLIIIQQLFHKV